MSRRALITLSPRDPVTGVAAAVRLAGGGGMAPFFHGGLHYRAGIAKLPRFGSVLDFGEAGWTGGTTPRTGTILFAPAQSSLLDDLAGRYWPGAAVAVDIGPEAGPFVRAMTGAVAAASVDRGALLLTVADLSYGLDRKSLSARFLGTGGIEGISEAGGRIKRRSWGRVYDVECRILDKANCIYEVGDPSRPLALITEVRDKGRAGPIVALAWQGSIAATFAALQAAAAPDGGGVVAPSIACIKWWTTAAGPLCADLRGETAGGYVDHVADIMVRVLAAMAGPALTNQAAMAAARPGPAGLHLGDADETIAQALDRLLLGVSLLWALDPAGTITLREISFGAPVETIRSSAVSRVRQLPPHRARRIGYQRNHKQHGDGEISLAIDTAKQVKLTSNRALITYDQAGAPIAGQTIVVKATRINTTADIVWALTDQAGNDRTAYLATADDTATLTAANFQLARGAGTGVIFIASVTDGGTVSDSLPLGAVSNGADGTLAWTPVFDPAQWRRVGATFIRLVAGWDLTKPVTSAELLPYLSVSWTIPDHAQRNVMGITDDTHAYTLFCQGTGGVLEWVTDPVAVGAPRGTVGAYAIGQRLTVAHRGDFIQALVDGVEVYRWTGIDPASKWRAYGMAADVSAISTFSDVALSIGGAIGADGDYQDQIFVSSYAPPATPAGSNPAGWTNDPSNGEPTEWVSKADKDADGNLLGTWSIPAVYRQARSRPYSAGTTYYQGNPVSYDSGGGAGSYALKVSSSIGNAPSGTAEETAYWAVVAAPGAPGQDATPPAAFTATINLTSSTGTNLRTAADAAGYPGGAATITFKVPAGVTIRGLAGSPHGGVAIDTGTWPAGVTIANGILIESGGVVEGGGGKGGGTLGGSGLGGDAIFVRGAMSGGVTVNAGGRLAGGGGGGGAGGTYSTGGPVAEREQVGGGGGGGGQPNGGGGFRRGNINALVGWTNSVDGTAATTGAVGVGGAGGTGGGIAAGAGGNGAAYGAAGSAGGNPSSTGAGGFNGAAGGAGGSAVRKNGFACVVTNNGTMIGAAA